MPLTRTVTGLLRASHPEPAAAVTAVTTGLAIAVGRDARGVLVVTLTVAASQLAVGWHNDWLDAARDAMAGRADKPVATGAIGRRLVGRAAAAASLVCIGLALLSGPAAALAATIGLAAGLAYNWPLKFTAWSVVPYLISFAAVPAFVVLGRPEPTTPPWWLLLGGATLGGAAHFANVLPDLEQDVRTGVRGLPHRLGPRLSAFAATTLLAVATMLIVLGPPGSPALLAWVGLVVAVALLGAGTYRQLRRPQSRAAFRAILIAALINVAMLLAVGGPALRAT